MNPKDLRYAETHEWARLHGDTCTVGITQFAIDQLTDVVHIELPTIGRKLESGKGFGEIESVKAVSDLYAPVPGEVVAVNDALLADPSVISRDPYGAGWMIKIRVPAGTSLGSMLTAEQYETQIASLGH